jgi:hypothetical protein
MRRHSRPIRRSTPSSSPQGEAIRIELVSSHATEAQKLTGQGIEKVAGKRLEAEGEAEVLVILSSGSSWTPLGYSAWWSGASAVTVV